MRFNVLGNYIPKSDLRKDTDLNTVMVQDIVIASLLTQMSSTQMNEFGNTLIASAPSTIG